MKHYLKIGITVALIHFLLACGLKGDLYKVKTEPSTSLASDSHVTF